MKFESAMQLKSWIKNKSKETNAPANVLLQSYMMERLLERVSISPYRENLILKGGFLIAAMIGVERCSTMDLDTTVKGLSINREKLENVLREIVSIDAEDGIVFEILDMRNIHDISEYDDFRVSLQAAYHTIKVDMKLDVTIGDAIIPGAVEFPYKLMFEDRTIPVMAYNLCTVLAEKIETILSRNVANTRGRDFYDAYVLLSLNKDTLAREELLYALRVKAEERDSVPALENHAKYLREMAGSPDVDIRKTRFAHMSFIPAPLTKKYILPREKQERKYRGAMSARELRGYRMNRTNSVAQIDQSVHWHERHPFVRVRTTFSSRHPYATHFHDCLSVGVLFKGETELRRSGIKSILNEGQTVLIAPMEPHSCNPLGGRERGYHMLYIDTEWALKTLGAQPASRLIANKRILDDKPLFAALMRLAKAIREGRDDSPGCDALAETIKANCTFRPVSEETSFSSWTDGDAPSVGQGARELGMRRETFIRSFRRATGVTPLQYRQCLKLIRAGELLRKGRSLVDTALSCGYADQSHFHRMCVKYLSATPIQMKPRKNASPSLSFKK